MKQGNPEQLSYKAHEPLTQILSPGGTTAVSNISHSQDELGGSFNVN